MRIVEGFCTRHVMNETIAIPAGKAAKQLSGLIALNEVGEFLFRLLQQDQTLESLVAAVTEAYDISYGQALEDTAEFINMFHQAGLIIDSPSEGSGKEG